MMGITLVDGSKSQKMSEFMDLLDGKQEYIGKYDTYRFHEVNEAGCHLWRDSKGQVMTVLDIYIREN